MCVMPFVSVTKVVIQGRVAQEIINTQKRLMLFNVIQFFAAFVVNTALNLRSLPQNFWITFGAAAATAVFSASFQSFYALAMRQGPVGKTSIINNFASFPPLILGVLFFHEALGIWKIIAIACMVVAFVLIPKDTGEPMNWRWFLLAMAAMLSSSAMNVVLLFLGKTPSFAEDRDFYFSVLFLMAFLFSLVLYLRICRRSPDGDTVASMFRMPRYFWGAAAVGALVCVYNYLVPVVLSGVDSTVFYPVTALGGMTVAALAGVILFREHLSLRSGIGILVAMVSILLTNIG